MGRSSSDSSQSTSSHQETTDVTTSVGDNRVTDSGHIGGNVTLGQTSGNVSVTTTDYGAMQMAGEAINNANVMALDFGSEAIEGMGDVSRDAIYSNQEVAEQSIDLSGDMLSESLDFGRDAIDTLDYNTGRALDFGQDALSFTGESRDAAFDFGSDALERVTDSFQFWSEQTSQNTDRALAFATNANTSEGAQLAKDGVKYVATAAGLLGAIILLKG